MKVGLLIWLGGLVQLYLAWEISRWTLLPEEDRQIFFYSGLVTAAGCFVAGPAYAAAEKGYNLAVGILLGLLSPMGMLIVYLMPNKKA